MLDDGLSVSNQIKGVVSFVYAHRSVFRNSSKF